MCFHCIFFVANNHLPEFFDVKFYPYNPIGADPIFAAVSKKHVCNPWSPIERISKIISSYSDKLTKILQVVVCRLSQTAGGNPCQVIRVIRDDDVSCEFFHQINSLTQESARSFELFMLLDERYRD